MEKGVGNLIAVVLLVLLTITVGTTTFLFLKKFTAERIEEVEEEDDCDGVSIKIIDACYDSEIKIKVESKSSQKVDKGFLVEVDGENDMVIPSLPFTLLESFHIEEIKIPYEQELGILNEVKLIPKIRREDGSQIVCSIQSEKSPISRC